MHFIQPFAAVFFLFYTTFLFAGHKASPKEHPEEPATAPGYMSLENEPKKPGRYLASESKEADLEHYKKTERRFGVDLGMVVPFGDFQKDFSTAPLLGLHFIWGAIEPFNFSVSTYRASVSNKNGPALGKLTVSSIAVGTTASFPFSRFIPFLKLEGAFHFNDVSFDASRTVTAGHDGFMTTVGLNVGVGGDFIVGREVSVGLDATYHYAIPKKVTLSTGSQYDLGSSYASASFRLNF